MERPLAFPLATAFNSLTLGTQLLTPKAYIVIERVERPQKQDLCIWSTLRLQLTFELPLMILLLIQLKLLPSPVQVLSQNGMSEHIMVGYLPFLSSLSQLLIWELVISYISCKCGPSNPKERIEPQLLRLNREKGNSASTIRLKPLASTPKPNFLVFPLLTEIWLNTPCYEPALTNLKFLAAEQRTCL